MTLCLCTEESPREPFPYTSLQVWKLSPRSKRQLVIQVTPLLQRQPFGTEATPKLWEEAEVSVRARNENTMKLPNLTVAKDTRE